MSVENTHSIASASRDGSVHVWRVDLAPSKPTDQYGETLTTAAATSSLRVSGSSVVRTIDSNQEGAILSVQHYNTDVCSVLVYATQSGGVHGWDLRCPEPVFRLGLRPELGYATSMTVAPDRQWISVGSSKGYLALWDLRYNTMSSLYQHSSASPLHRLACCKAVRNLSSTQAGLGLSSTEGAYVFIATNNNEAAVFGLPEGGECYKCFRSLMLNDSKQSLAPLPVLAPISVPTHPFRPVMAAYQQPSSVYSPHAVRSMIGRISQTNSSYLITAGSDKHIRFWDFRAPENCYTVAGIEATQSKSLF
ncbi:WD40 repeat domain-containing protein, partial [archaeon]